MTAIAAINLHNNHINRPHLSLVPLQKQKTRLRMLSILKGEGEALINTESKATPMNMTC